MPGWVDLGGYVGGSWVLIWWLQIHVNLGPGRVDLGAGYNRWTLGLGGWILGAGWVDLGWTLGMGTNR